MTQGNRFLGLTKRQIWIVFTNLNSKRAYEFLSKRQFQTKKPTPDQVKITTAQLLWFIKAHAIKQKAMR